MTERILYEKLKCTSPELAEELDKICDEALNIWKEQHLQEFTAHGKPHIEKVEKNLAALVAPLDANTPLTEHEIFILVAACYLHDIGMQFSAPDAREAHAECVYHLILYSDARVPAEERRVTLPINDRNARRCIAHVARGHWTSFALNLEPVKALYGEEEGRLRLLGLLLATADLLDLSPVRARYFRTIHRLYDLPPLSELHQAMHNEVRISKIEAPNRAMPGDLRFHLAWHRDDGLVKDMNDWVMDWLDAQWRQLAPALRTESGGTVNWTDPWVKIEFNPPEGPQESLSDKARYVLNMERAEQKRIDRNDFVETFKSALDGCEPALFLLPSHHLWDGKELVEWCKAQAAIREASSIICLSTEPSSTDDRVSLTNQLVEQLGGHLAVCTENEAIAELCQYVQTTDDKVILVIVRIPVDPPPGNRG